MGEMADHYLDSVDFDDESFGERIGSESQPQVCNRCGEGRLYWGRWHYSNDSHTYLQKLYSANGKLHNCIGFKTHGFNIIPFAKAKNYGQKQVHVVGWSSGSVYVIESAYLDRGIETYTLSSPKTKRRFRTTNPLYYTKTNKPI